MSEKNSKAGMVSPPKEASSYTNLVDEIKKIIEMKLPCEEDFEVEILCDDCPWDIVPKIDCGLALLQERARMLKLEGESGDKYPEHDKCSECPQPSTHPSGLCRDCYQAKLEMKEN